VSVRLAGSNNGLPHLKENNQTFTSYKSESQFSTVFTAILRFLPEVSCAVVFAFH
jgi:hypothetical protein